MKFVRRTVIFLSSLGVLAVCLYAGYVWWFADGFLPEETTPTKPRTEAPPSDQLDVTLPEALQKQGEREKQKRRRIYRRAVQAHRRGDLEQAAADYREAIALSGPGSTAARSYRFLGDIYARQGQTHEALRFYRYAIRVKPSESVYYYRMARVLHRTGQRDDARTFYQQALERDARSEYYLALGNLHFEQGQYSRALKAYKSGIDAGEQRARLYVNLGVTQQNLENYAGAISSYQRAREFQLSQSLHYRIAMNKGRLHRNLDEYDEAEEEFQRAASIRDSADALYNLGRTRLEAGQLTSARDALERARQKQPSDPDILTNLAYAHERMEEWDRAATLYQQAYKQAPRRHRLLFASGRAHEKAGQFERALNQYRTLSESVSPDNASGDTKRLLVHTYRRAGELYLNMGKPRLATRSFEELLKLRSGLHEVHYNLGLAHRRLDQGDRAIGSFRRALEGNNDSIRYRYALAETLYESGRPGQALEQYQSVLTRDRDHSPSRYMVGYIFYEWGKLDEARDAFQNVLSDASDDAFRAQLHRNLGNVYMKKKQYEKARVAYQESLQIQKQPETYYNLGLNFVREREWDKAARSFRYAQERSEDVPQIYTALGMVLYHKGLYREAREFLQKALSMNPDDARAQYDLQRVQAKLEASRSGP